MYLCARTCVLQFTVLQFTVVFFDQSAGAQISFTETCKTMKVAVPITDGIVGYTHCI